MLKIISGEFRSRRLQTPPDDQNTRPYPHRVREAVFNRLREWFEGARVLDLFAGVGSMGLEAVSQGATEVLMVEQNRMVFRILQQNIATLDCADRAQAMCGDALSSVCLARAPGPVDIVFIDPPYKMMEREESRQQILTQMSRCRSVMGPEGFLILRSPFGMNEKSCEVDGLVGPEEHAYGKGMFVLFYEPEKMDSSG